jgi:hypothetical protein
MIRERSELDAIASEIQASDQAVALDLETYGTSEDKKIKKDETLDPWPNLIRFQARYSESHNGHSASGLGFSQPVGRLSAAGHNPSAS